MQLRRWTIVAWVLPLITVTQCSWGEPGSSQYHIQTDEGPERYFRFQTDNGQFRKEKRLQDGTVIGTEAWIDAAGFLRQKDYIADSNGYRILKSKTVFVGQTRKIADAIKLAKSTPAQSGVLVDGSSGLNANSVQPVGNRKQANYFYSTTTPVPPRENSIASEILPDQTKLNYLPPSEAAKIEPSPYLGFDHYPDELLPPKLPPQRSSHVHAVPTPRRRAPNVHIRPYSVPINENENIDIHSNTIAPINYEKNYATTSNPFLIQHATPTPPMPSLAIEPPFENENRRLRPIAVVAATPTPIAVGDADETGYSTPSPFVAIQTRIPAPAPAPAPAPTPIPVISTRSNGYSYTPVVATPHSYGGSDNSYAHPFDVNSLEGVLLPPPLPPRPPSGHSHYAQRVLNNNVISEDYDGVSGTRNGFRYVLPHQYHEEAQFGDKRAGSFGYVDPFGIRRVVYYNSSPGRGFVHRNNNRYVGLGAPPYDPVGPESASNVI